MTYSRFVKLIKYSLFFIVCFLPLLLAANIAFLYFKKNEEAVPLLSDENGSTLSKLYLVGKTQGGDNYLLHARQLHTIVAQKDNNDNTFPSLDNIFISKPRLIVEFTKQKNGWLFLQAPSGHYDDKKKILFLTEGMDFFTSYGYEGHTALAQIDLTQARMRSQATFYGHGPLGTLEGDRIFIHQNEGYLLLGPHVHGHIFLSSRKANTTPHNFLSGQDPVFFSGTQLTFDKNKRALTLEKDVNFKQNNQSIACQSTTFVFKDGPGASLESVSMEGPIYAYLKDGQTISAYQGSYNPDQHKMTLEKNVCLKQGGDEVKGEKLIIDLVTGQSRLTAKKGKRTQGHFSI